MLAAYGRLSNTGPTAVDIVDFTSDGFDEISLHETTIENGISRMKRVPAWTLEPGSELLLEPGGRHLMLVGPHRQLGPGDEIQLTIYTSSGAEYRFVVPVVLP